ncbi:cupin domain-containing protein [Psychrobacter sp. DM4]|uniref:cupin domain-containing protein n=1 Tax=Psychrobacter sp. DM4 TaxID=3440637 RepID=UPI003F508937
MTREKSSYEGKEDGTVIEGKTLIRADDITYLLNQGSSYMIDTSRPHTFINSSDTTAHVISAHTPTIY